MTDVIEREVELWDVEKLIPYEKNAKKHDKRQVAKIAASIREFGWSKSKAIEVEPDGTIINGHGRRLAALELDYSKVPVVVRDDLTPEQIRAYRLADNKVAESEYDTGLLSSELQDLHGSDVFDMSDFFDDRDLDFATEDLGEMDLGELTDDINMEVDQHREQTQEAVGKSKNKKTDIGEALGFKKVDEDQRRTLHRVVVLAEDQTGLTGAAALVQFLDENILS